MNKFSTGEILRSVCRELNLTNKEIADILSTSHQNVSRIFLSDNVNTDTINKLTKGLGINIYAALAKKWEEYSEEQLPGVSEPAVEREYVRMEPKIKATPDRPKISILIEINRDQQDEVLKLLNLGKLAT
ncbi:MAG: hypothetical protein ACK4SF_04630 [Algoriphagus aquaeductus]|uniref:hypothetical protein n=1 Tax=Algoriphagus aquaeductus TaxID=475299 RepID=UPI00391D1F9C